MMKKWAKIQMLSAVIALVGIVMGAPTVAAHDPNASATCTVHSASSSAHGDNPSATAGMGGKTTYEDNGSGEFDAWAEAEGDGGGITHSHADDAAQDGDCDLSTAFALFCSLQIGLCDPLKP